MNVVAWLSPCTTISSPNKFSCCSAISCQAESTLTTTTATAIRPAVILPVCTSFFILILTLFVYMFFSSPRISMLLLLSSFLKSWVPLLQEVQPLSKDWFFNVLSNKSLRLCTKPINLWYYTSVLNSSRIGKLNLFRKLYPFFLIHPCFSN